MQELFYKIDLYDNQKLDYFSIKPGAFFDATANYNN